MSTPRMKDVAAYANVSKATVSRVLNRDPRVAEDLRLRVEEAISVLGYSPNRAARRLRGISNDVLGLIISDIENPYFTSVVRGVEDAAYANHMHIVLCNSDEDPVRLQRYLRIMEEEQVAGLLIVPIGTAMRHELLRFRAAEVPVILIDRTLDQVEIDAVVVDNLRGAFSAVHHLIQVGHKRIALIGGLPNSSTGRERAQGYRDALNHAGLPVDSACVKVGDFKLESGYRLARELLTAAEKPDAIFAANNLMTLGALRAFGELGVRVPEDVALVGFDDMPWADELCPSLTTVAQPTYELGQEAVQLLLRRLSNPHAPYRTVSLQTRLMVRESCGAKLRRNHE